MHQQSLSRLIKRLVDLGLIEQIKHYGFRLTKLGRHLGMANTSENSNIEVQKIYSIGIFGYAFYKV